MIFKLSANIIHRIFIPRMLWWAQMVLHLEDCDHQYDLWNKEISKKKNTKKFKHMGTDCGHFKVGNKKRQKE